MKKRAIVKLDNARVLIVDKKDYWFAQCLDIDYCAQGTSMDDVKKNFEDGFVGSIKANLEAFGSLDNFLKAPPLSVRENLLGHSEHDFSCIANYELSNPSIPTYGALEFLVMNDNYVSA